MEAPSLRHFLLGSTFFGFKPEDRVRNHESLFYLIWFGDGRWSWHDVYHMPVFLRSFWIDKCNEIKSRQDAAIQKSKTRTKSQPSSPPTKRPR